jgi:hypothetical protein
MILRILIFIFNHLFYTWKVIFYLFTLIANGFLLDGSGTTIRHNTQITHHHQTKRITQNYTNNDGHTIHNEYNKVSTLRISCRCLATYFNFYVRTLHNLGYKFPPVAPAWDWVHLVSRPLTGLLCRLQMIYDECGAVNGMGIGRRNRCTGRKRTPLPLCPPQIPHDLTWARTQTAAVGNLRLTWTMARPSTWVT